MKTLPSIIQQLAPEGKSWIKYLEAPIDGYIAHVWKHSTSDLMVFSSVEVAQEEIGPEYHLSVSKNGRRCTSDEANWALRCFKMEGAYEDNHVPFGVVRNFWKPVAERLIGIDCPCESSETAFKEDKGDYIWREAPNGS